jgi:glyoxylase-like metal-dependent hydrolase (beta-lactamase superfamily II)
MSSCGPWEANCYLVGATDSGECVVIDAGMDAAPVVERLLGECGRTPVAVLATHGHLDHVADAHTVADTYGIPVWIHAADRHLLSDPVAGPSPELGPLVSSLYGSETLPEPADVREWEDADWYGFAGLRWTVLHAPGHTPGSVLLHAFDGHASRLFSGDVLFAGAIGRTDLPGGSMSEMAESLRETVLTLPYDLAVLPGHGTRTSIGRECATNPYLQLSFLEQNS